MTVLIDTSFLLALAVTRDPNHALAQTTINIINTVFVLPIPVMPELFYMISVRANYKAAVNNFGYLQRAGFQVEPISLTDRERMAEIMAKYLDAQFDFVDIAIMALAERLEITQILTFDRRDFTIFRPRHCAYLELFP